MKYPRTQEGFSRAFEDAKRMARNHPTKTYAILVDARDPEFYAVGLASLVRPEHVAEGTAANIVDADGNQTRMFADEQDGR